MSPHQTEVLFVVRNKVTSPYLVEVKVNGHPLTMEVDSEAAIICYKTAVAPLMSFAQLQPSNTVLKTYSGEQI